MNPISGIIREFRASRKQIEMSRDEMRAYLKPYEENVLLYGAGSSGIAFLYDIKKIGIVPRFFVDSNQSKIGLWCEGIDIISPQDIKERISGEFIVIVCINTDGRRYCKSFDEALRIGGHHGVYEMLHSVGCKNVIDYTFFRHCFSIFTDEKYNAPSCSDVDLMLEHENELVSVYDILDDDLSRETYEKIVKFRLIDDSIIVPTLPQKNQYFESGLYHPRSDAVFIDCGAYNGISAETFISIQRKEFTHYYGFEPDPYNYVELNKYIDSLPNGIKSKMTISDHAVWNTRDQIKLYRLNGPGSFVASDIGTEIVDASPIDDCINTKEAITFIKMNIEGSEKQALSGCEKMIREYKPELAIAGYHRTEDLWDIPLMIRHFCSEYRINLRSYMNHISFVYYAN